MNAPTTGFRARLIAFSENGKFQRLIVGLIILNAITLGLETSTTVMAAAGTWIIIFDHIILTVFVIELTIRMAGYGWRFFTEPWNIFDFIVVGVAVVPATDNFSVLRALRVLRLLSVLPSMRRVVEALLSSLPGLGAVAAVLTLIFYVAAVMATQLFGGAFPEWFGTLPRSLYSLFQIMTLESWSMGIVRPVMEHFAYAWAFFVPFILIATFTMLNLFIAVVVSAMEATATKSDEQIEADGADAVMRAEMTALRADVGKLLARLEAKE